MTTIDKEQAVRERYSAVARDPDAELCCPGSYDPKLLEVIPLEVIERDYGCGDASGYLRSGEVVLDLGSGAGKACFIAAQVVGRSGRVIGVDMNDDMLEVARRNSPEVAARLGYHNVEFKKGRIQDLALDLDKLDSWLRRHPVHGVEDLSQVEAATARFRDEEPMIAKESIDVITSSCVLNLVRPEDKHKLFGEMFRVLRRGGRVVISDIVSDDDIPPHLAADPELWSGCISGAFREDYFLQQFEAAGFYGISILDRQPEPWRTVEGIEFRGITVAAYKGKQGPCWERKQAVIYGGPFRQVEDDDGHVLRRGVPTAVCHKTFQLYSKDPYQTHVHLVPPRIEIPLVAAQPFPCGAAVRREPRETKGEEYRVTTQAESCCEPKNGNGGRC